MVRDVSTALTSQSPMRTEQVVDGQRASNLAFGEAPQIHAKVENGSAALSRETKQEASRSPLPVSRIIQRGSLAPPPSPVCSSPGERKDHPKLTHSAQLSGMVAVHGGDSDADESNDDGGDASLGTADASIEIAMALLRKLQEQVSSSSSTSTSMSNDQSDSSAGIIVTKDEVDQILAGFAKALESSASSRGIEDEMQQLFLSHANVFDEDMQNFFIQNFIHEAECAKTFRTTVRRTSLVRRCLLAMYPAEKNRCTTESSRWNASLVARAVQHRRSNSLEVCPEVDNPVIIEAVKSEIAKLCDWDFNVFVIADAVPGQTLSIVGNALLEKYEFCCHFRSSKAKMHHFLRQIELKYHNHPYHNAVHAADVAQSIHHLLTPAGLGESFSPRTKCAAILAAIVHDVGHTSYSNNFHITVNDDLAIQYVYRSPLEHMHCAVAFQLLRNPKCNILQGLTKIEQLEVRNLITDMVLATDNSVHSAYLGKLEGLVCRSADDGWKLCDPDDEKLILQMALHAADVSNPAKSTAMCKIWAERIMQEFYQQGDKERKLQLPVSFGCDRENPIPLEKMQAGFIIGIVRPLFNAICQLPKVELSQCMKRLDENLLYWQSELAGNSARSRED